LAGEFPDKVVQAVAAVHDDPAGFFPGKGVDLSEKFGERDGGRETDPAGGDPGREEKKAVRQPERESLAFQGVKNFAGGGVGDVDQGRQPSFFRIVVETGGFVRGGFGTGNGRGVRGYGIDARFGFARGARKGRCGDVRLISPGGRGVAPV
jgi:hypothetical protein